MTQYTLPTVSDRGQAAEKTAYLISSGDLRESANTAGWSTQVALEEALATAFEAVGYSIVRANDVDPETGHGFISNQRMGMDVFADIPADAPVIVAEAVWQYSHHVLAGLTHAPRARSSPPPTGRGPVARPGGTAQPQRLPDQGGHGVLAPSGARTSPTSGPRKALAQWVDDRRHRARHLARARPARPRAATRRGASSGRRSPHELRQRQGHHGRLRRGLHGHVQRHHRRRAAQPHGYLQGAPVSQSAPCSPNATVSPTTKPRPCSPGSTSRGMTFQTRRRRRDRAHRRARCISQCKMYIAALRIADDFGGDAGSASSTSRASRTWCRPPTWPRACSTTSSVRRCRRRDGDASSEPGQPLPHFNEVDEGVGVDALITNRVWTAMGLDPATTPARRALGRDLRRRLRLGLRDLRLRARRRICEAATRASTSERQSPMYFRLGGGTIKGVSQARAEIVWSRLPRWTAELHVDIGRASVVELPDEETERRWQSTNPQWPIMHAGDARRDPRPVDGPPQGQPHPGRLRAGRGDRRQGAGGQGCDVRGARRARAPLR